ncbi:hypothetical protein ACU4GH_39290 [Bradyrhizobium betae]
MLHISGGKTAFVEQYRRVPSMENWFQRACLILVSIGRNDDRNHIDERQLNGVE